MVILTWQVLSGELDRLLRRMRLPYLRWPPRMSSQLRGRSAGTPAQLLEVLLHEEIVGRDAATRRLHRKKRESPDREVVRLLTPGGHPRAHPGALSALEWIGRAEDLGVVGPSRIGKSHFVDALAHAATEVDLRVAWFTLESLTATLGWAEVGASFARTVSRILRADLIVVDDIGMLPAGQDAAEALYRSVDGAFEHRSLAVTSNIPSGFDTPMSKTVATATVDLLLHHAHLVQTIGDSHRPAEALAGKRGPLGLTGPSRL
ncbi:MULTISPECIES: ATP-binding protein [unclassified Pseudonocardia]|uniref:ATP-binding protein n=1 Tax=unclassified Pseudonocardia TaxID=2619320 RepID=UPI000A58487D|nr:MULTISPECIES: ATP-binding protein [unclassified Pseudonocardia]